MLSYQLDGEDRILFVSDEWLGFARENGAPALTRENVITRPIWDFISGASTRHLYELVFERVRSRQRFVTLPFRCDAPDRRRYMELGLSPLADCGICVVSRLLKEEPREPLRLLDSALARSDEFLETCSWCKRIRARDGTWLEPERAIERNDLFDAPRPPHLTHTACPECDERARAAAGAGKSDAR